jgi:hypothetical protein
MMMMAQIELDAVKTCDFSAIDKFYENNLSAIVKLDSPSLSLRSSTSRSARSKVNDDDESSESTCPSDSETEELALNALRLKDQFLKYHQKDCSQQPSNQLFSKDGDHTLVNHIVADKNVASGTKIDTIAIQNSTDIQFGNKTFYNGPVFIKQFIKDENKKWISAKSGEENLQIESGVVNKGFNKGKIQLANANLRKMRT